MMLICFFIAERWHEPTLTLTLYGVSIALGIVCFVCAMNSKHNRTDKILCGLALFLIFIPGPM